MFVGHYGPAAALAGGRIKLWHGVVAVQFLDILWAPFVLLGVENIRIVENFTASNHLDLYHMPYSHSLVMALIWSGAAGLLFRHLRGDGGIVIAGLVFSHWVLDYITHVPDLLLWFDGIKVGLGLWQNRPLALLAEFTILIGGFALYVRRTRATGTMGWVSLFVFLLIATASQGFGNFGPPPGGPEEAAALALFAFGIFTILAMWVDASRRPKSAE